MDQPIPGDLEALLLACLEKVPERRPLDARNLQDELRACADARSWREDDARRWFAAHGESLRARQSRTTVHGAATVAVDLGLRVSDPPVAPRRAG